MFSGGVVCFPSSNSISIQPTKACWLPFTDFIYKLKFSSDDDYNYVNFELKETHVIRLENLFGTTTDSTQFVFFRMRMNLQNAYWIFSKVHVFFYGGGGTTNEREKFVRTQNDFSLFCKKRKIFFTLKFCLKNHKKKQYTYSLLLFVYWFSFISFL